MTRPLKKGDGRLDWSRPAEELARQVRAYSPWPGAFTTWQGARVKILRAHAVLAEENGAPGTSHRATGNSAAWLEICCGQGALALDVIQLEGKRALPIGDVLRGHPALAEAVFGT